MYDFHSRLILLNHCRGAGWKTIYTILKDDPALEKLLAKSIEDWRIQLPQLKQTQLSLFYHDLHSINITQKMQQYEDNSIRMLTYFDEAYPQKLKQIYNPPWVIYLKGKLSLLEETKALGVVGVRQPSPYGKEAISHLLPPLIKDGFVIVSGLASGIDTLAHRAAIEHRGSTIAVLGGGLFHIYPKDNIRLALHMMNEQLVLSEYPPSMKPERWMFPMRNRLISGLSDGVLIVEAKEKSGSLITAYHALEQGKDVFAVPGNITTPFSVGTNQLIQEGAKLVLHANDIVSEMKYLFLPSVKIQ